MGKGNFEYIKIGSVGQALPLCDVKISDQNEILIKHKALMNGYYKDEDQTNQTIKSTQKIQSKQFFFCIMCDYKLLNYMITFSY